VLNGLVYQIKLVRGLLRRRYQGLELEQFTLSRLTDKTERGSTCQI